MNEHKLSRTKNTIVFLAMGFLFLKFCPFSHKSVQVGLSLIDAKVFFPRIICKRSFENNI